MNTENSTIKLLNLADLPHHLEQVAKWCFEEWSKANGSTIEDIIYRTKHACKQSGIPQTWIAVNGDELVGTFALWNCDIFNRQDLSPWIACVYVKPEYRNAGIGTMMTQKGVDLMRNMNYKKVYLHTDHENYYEKTGWKLLEIAPLKAGKTTRIYEYELF